MSLRFTVALSLIAWLTMSLLPLRAFAQDSHHISSVPSEANNNHEMATTIADPLAPLNEKFFVFNEKLDHYVTRPIATGWSRVAPVPVRKAFDRFFDNLNVIPRFANNLFQGKFRPAGGEVARFFINTTVGGLGFFDPADKWFGLKEHPQDFGLTMGYYGVGMGPYLMIPIFGPFDFRDGVGYLVDGVMNPIDWILGIVQVVAIYSGIIAANAVNYESLHLELFEDADRYSIDLYGAVQDAYVQRRQRLLYEALHPEQSQPQLQPGQPQQHPEKLF
jgi:phospholipid-binding lipoprotein MlaA